MDVNTECERVIAGRLSVAIGQAVRQQDSLYYDTGSSRMCNTAVAILSGHTAVGVLRHLCPLGLYAVR